MTDNELLNKALVLRGYLIDNDLDPIIETLEEINQEIKDRALTNSDIPKLLASYIWEIASGSYGREVEGYIYVVNNLFGLKEQDKERELFKLYNLALLSGKYNIISLEDFLDKYAGNKEIFDSLSFMQKASVVKMLIRNQLDNDEIQDKKNRYLELIRTWLEEAENQEGET